MTGSPQTQQVLSLEDAVAIARTQRDELLAGAEVLASLDTSDTSDASYAQLQTAMEKAAPKLSGDAWAHKYWFLTNPDRLDDYHPRVISNSTCSSCCSRRIRSAYRSARRPRSTER